MSQETPQISEKDLYQRRERVKEKARIAIEHLATVDLAAAASILRVGRIDVVDDNTIPTAALQREHGFTDTRFRIILNAEFCDRSQRDVTAIMLHELLHHVMRHLDSERVGPDPQLANLVEDAFINRAIHMLNPDLGGFFSDFYDGRKMPQLVLRSGSNPMDADDARLYDSLQNGHITEADLYTALKQKGGDSASDVQLIGSHDQDGDNRSALPEGGVEKIIQELGEQLRARGSKGRSEASRLEKMAEEFLRLRQSKRVAPLQRAMQRAVTDQLQSALLQRVVGTDGKPFNRSPLMPERPARADMYWILAGIEPVLWRVPETRQDRGAVAVYLDVSGSMSGYLGTVYECCLAFEEYLATDIYLFSNQVETIQIGDLKAGAVKTTFGTDFDCVVEHFLERPNLKRAVIFSDGYAGLDNLLKDRLQSSQQEMIGVLTPRGQDRIMSTFCAEIFQMPDSE